MPDSVVLNVRQILQYPPKPVAAPTDAVLVQTGGLGGPYMTLTAAALVSTALESGAASLGVGYVVPANSDGSQIFTGNLVLPNTGGALFNAYWDNTATLRYWQSGPAGAIVFENGTFDIQIAASGNGGAPLANLQTVLQLNPDGSASMPLGTLTVAHDAANPLDVVTLQQLDSKLTQAVNSASMQIMAWAVGNFLPLSGGQLSGPLILFNAAAGPMEPVTLQQMTAAIDAIEAGGGTPVVGPAQTFNTGDTIPIGWWFVGPDGIQTSSGNFSAGQTFFSDGTTTVSNPATFAGATSATASPITGSPSGMTGFLPLSGGALTGALTLPANAAAPMQAVPLAQVNNIVAGYLPLTGGTLSGPLTVGGILTLGGIATQPLQAVPFSQMSDMVTSLALYQGVWQADTNTPDLNAANPLNDWAWIVRTPDPNVPVTVGGNIPGLTGNEVHEGDHVIWSTVEGRFDIIRGSNLNMSDALGLFLPFTGGTMTGNITMGSGTNIVLAGPGSGNEPVTYVQMQSALGTVTTGYMPISGGTFTGTVTLAGDAASNLQPVTLQQMTAAIAGFTPGGNFMPITGGTFTGPVTLAANASLPLEPVSLQQLEALLAGIGGGGTPPDLTGLMPKSGGTFTGPVIMGVGTTLTLAANANANMQAVTLQQLNSAISAIPAGMPLTGGTFTGPVTMAASQPLTLSVNPASGMQATSFTQVQAMIAAAGTGTGNYLPLVGGTISGSPGWVSVGTALPANTAANQLSTGTALIAPNWRQNLYTPTTSGTALNYAVAGVGSQLAQSAGALTFANAPSGAQGAAATLTTRFTVDASGNTSNPGWSLTGGFTAPAATAVGSVLAGAFFAGGGTTGAGASGGSFNFNTYWDGSVSRLLRAGYGGQWWQLTSTGQMGLEIFNTGAASSSVTSLSEPLLIDRTGIIAFGSSAIGNTSAGAYSWFGPAAGTNPPIYGWTIQPPNDTSGNGCGVHCGPLGAPSQANIWTSGYLNLPTVIVGGISSGASYTSGLKIGLPPGPFTGTNEYCWIGPGSTGNYSFWIAPPGDNSGTGSGVFGGGFGSPTSAQLYTSGNVTANNFICVNYQVGTSKFSCPIGSGVMGFATLNNAASGTFYPAIFFNSAGGTVGSISASNTNTAFNTSSDVRLKTRDTPYTGGLAVINKLKVHRFHWKVDGSEDVGVMAQEVDAVYPRAVTRGDDRMPWSVDYSKFVPALIEAVQELSKRLGEPPPRTVAAPRRR